MGVRGPPGGAGRGAGVEARVDSGPSSKAQAAAASQASGNGVWPAGQGVSDVEQALASLPGVLELEELHVWGLSTSRTALTAHVVVDPQRLASQALSRDQLLTLARSRLAELGIRKSTLQLESEEHQDSSQNSLADRST